MENQDAFWKKLIYINDTLRSAVINKAKEACRNAGGNIEDHFPDVRKVIKGGKGSKQEITDIALTRYATAT